MIIIKAINIDGILSPETPIPQPNFGVVSNGENYLVCETKSEFDEQLSLIAQPEDEP
jgi:hypothetical protein